MTVAPEPFLTDGHGGVRIAGRPGQGDPDARAVVFLHGGGQTRRSWGRAAAAGGAAGLAGASPSTCAVTVNPTGPPRATTGCPRFAADVREILACCRDEAGARRRVARWDHLDAAGRRTGPRRRRGSGPGRHRARHGSVRGRAYPRLHGRQDGRRIRLARRGRRHDRGVQPAPAAPGRSRWPAKEPAAQGGSLVLALGPAVHRRLRDAIRRWRSPTPSVCTPRSRPSSPTGCRCYWCAVRSATWSAISAPTEFLARFPQVAFVDVEGAGHMVAGDRNDLFADAVLDFLARAEVAKP